MERPKTIFCDIDGTLVRHSPPSETAKLEYKMEILPGTIEKLSEWERKGYNIILTTGRKESMRSLTEKQLSEAGIFYDVLIMGIGGGSRYIINDNKPNGEISCFSVSIERNSGISNIEI